MNRVARFAARFRCLRPSLQEPVPDAQPAWNPSQSEHTRQWSTIRPREKRARRVKAQHQAVISLWRDLIDKKEAHDFDADVFKQEVSLVASETVARCKSGYVPFAETLSVLHTCARLRYQPPPFISFLATELVHSGSLPNWSANQIAKCIYSLGALRAHASVGNRQSYVEGAAATVLFAKAILHVVERTGLENVNAFGLANIVYSVGKWGPSFAQKYPDICRALSFECVQGDRLKAFTAQGLSNVIYSLGLLGVKEPSVVIPLVAEASLDHRLQEFTEQHLSNIVYGLGLSRFNHHTKLFKLLQWTMNTAILQDFTPQGLCNFLTGLLRMDFRDVPRYMPLVHEASKQSQLGQMSAFQVASLVQACGGLGVAGSDGIDKQLARYATQPSLLADMKPRSLANVICGLAKMGVQDRTAWGALFGETRKKSGTHRHGVEELGAICWGMATCGFHDPSTLDHVLSNLSQSKVVDSSGLHKAVSQALYVSWRYGHVHEGFLGFAWEFFTKTATLLTDWDWMDMAWSLCLLDKLTLAKFEHICRMLQTVPSVDPPHLDNVPVKFDERVGRVDAHIRCYHSGASRDILSQLGFKKRRREQLNRLNRHARKNFQTSPTRSDVQEVLLRMGHAYESSVWIENFCHVDLRVDGLLLMVPDVKDYFTNVKTGDMKLMNPVANQVKLLEGLGHKVCCVDSIRWTKLSTEAQEKNIAQLLSSKT